MGERCHLGRGSELVSDAWNLASDPAGGKSLHRWSIEDGCTTVTSPAQYDVTSFTVGDDDVAQFQAVRLSDGRTVLASVTAAGAVTVLDESAAPEVITLERIR